MPEASCIRMRVHGRVQGVGFRAALEHEARRHGLAGWVRNRHDGTVEAVVAGEAGSVQALLAWARSGPPLARVDRVEVSPEGGRHEGFEQRPSA